MQELFDTLTNPYALSAIIFLSLFSTVFFMMGLRQKNLCYILLGIGSGVPTLGINDWTMWAIGVGICAIGLWVRARLDSV